MLGSTVQNLQGEELGTLNDLVVNPADNRVVYGVLASGGLLGLGEKLFAVPLSALQHAAKVDTLLLDMAQERLKQAPEFNPHNWPQMTDRQWIASVYTFYGLQPYWE
jgi:sporulation protein YlmC with PRC-barrel domain